MKYCKISLMILKTRGDVMSFLSNLFRKKEKKDKVDYSKTIIDAIGGDHEEIKWNNINNGMMKFFLSEYEEGKQNGYTPVILCVDRLLAETIDYNYRAENDIMQYRSELLSSDLSYGRSFLKNRLDEQLEGFKEFEGNFDIYGSFDDSLGRENSFTSPHLLDNFKEKAFLFRIPTANPWEVFAWIPFGGWNECPVEKDMMAVCKYWYELYGAVPAMISGDTLQMYCPSPVKNNDDAVKLAEEHYAFCNDIVDQGAGEINKLASILIDSTVWYFWWD